MTEIQIRNVKEIDFLDIMKVAIECEPIPIERDSIYHCLTRYFANTCFVAEKEGQIIGFILGWISQVDNTIAYVHNICVIPKNRKNKIASSLYDRFIRAVKDNGCDRIFLIAGSTNKISINFHKSLGFRASDEGEAIIIDGVRAVKDYNGPGEHKVVLCKDI